MPKLVALYLDPDSKAKLLEKVPAAHTTIHAGHITLALSSEITKESLVFPLGESRTVRVLGVAQDSKGQAVVVDGSTLILAKGRTAHITVSCADGVKPMYSKELISRGFTPFEVPFEVTGTIAEER